MRAREKGTGRKQARNQKRASKAGGKAPKRQRMTREGVINGYQGKGNMHPRFMQTDTAHQKKRKQTGESRQTETDR